MDHRLKYKRENDKASLIRHRKYLNDFEISKDVLVEQEKHSPLKKQMIKLDIINIKG